MNNIYSYIWAVYLQKGISEAGGSEAVGRRAKGPVPAASV
jgi:hypothetical protein